MEIYGRDIQIKMGNAAQLLSHLIKISVQKSVVSIMTCATKDMDVIFLRG